MLTRIGSLPPEQATAALAKRMGVRAWVSEAGGAAMREGLPVFGIDYDLAAKLTQAGVIYAGAMDGTSYSSETGQIDLRPKDGSLKLVTEASECFVVPANKRIEDKSVHVAKGDSYGTVYSRGRIIQRCWRAARCSMWCAGVMRIFV